jgi:hypothetical protein
VPGQDRRDLVLLHQVVHELLVLRRDHVLQRRKVAARDCGRHYDIDAVRLPVDVLVDPLQLDLQLLCAERQRTQHAHASGAADRRHHVAAVAERKDRELNPEFVRKSRFHHASSLVRPHVTVICPLTSVI